ncbi:MAG: hypothetical protein HKO66_07160 [Saprospiraceae bacterium]|nr:anhydro-N-acetylmuramic acid kinase [Bacteroidia bacterium]NNL91992.1 hypothetical protein [Saprospiraceae bacterium]
MRILGIMSGSSLDGIDMASVVFDDSADWSLESYTTIPIPNDLTEKLKRVVDMNAFEIAKVESDYSHFLSRIINQYIKSHKLQVDYVSIHGHTVLHNVDISTSWQLLNGGLVASLVNKKVVCDFRNGDMALGGQGTPMAVIADRDLFKGHDYYINLGGIANVSYQKDGQWQAYDICPCNQVSNYFANQLGKPYDANGQLAKQGEVREELVGKLLEEEYIKKPHPKSIDNTWIKQYWIPIMESYQLSAVDNLATHHAFLVKLISKLITVKGVNIFITGGGAKNKQFISDLQSELLGRAEVIVPNDEIIDFKESILMAYMAYLRVNETANFIHSASGAHRDVIGGCVYMS